MNGDLAQEAISAALNGNWVEAKKINEKILKEDAENSDALNRLARAYAELGNLQKAKSTCQKVLKIDPFNAIAVKSLEKWKTLKKGDTYVSHPSQPQTFLEEPGKTKVVSLLFLGSPKLLAKLDTGDEVILDTHSHRVSVTTTDNKYVGRLPDDLSARLRKLTKLGNLYKVFIKSVSTNDVKVFIKEEKRVPKLADVPSFPGEKIDYISFTPPELVHSRSDVTHTQEEDE
jgi:tetratricopeptide (TPR) repeat protein